MSSLGPQHINQSFGGVLQVPGGLTGTLQAVQDGNGVTSPLLLSTTAVSITGQAASEYAVNVMDFGAVGDGDTDDWAACQAALDYCLQHQVSHLHFPTPTKFYWLSRPLIGTLRRHCTSPSDDGIPQHLTISGGGSNTTILACDNSTVPEGGRKGGILLNFTAKYYNSTDPLEFDDHTGTYEFNVADNACSVQVRDLSITPIGDGAGTGFSFCYDKPRDENGDYIAGGEDFGRWTVRGGGGDKPSVGMYRVRLNTVTDVEAVFDARPGGIPTYQSWNLPIDISGTQRPHLYQVTSNSGNAKCETWMDCIVKAHHVYGPEFNACVFSAGNAAIGIDDYNETTAEGGWITNCRVAGPDIAINIHRDPFGRNNLMFVNNNSLLGRSRTVLASGIRRLWVTDNLMYWGHVDFDGSGNYVSVANGGPAIEITSAGRGRIRTPDVTPYLVGSSALLKADGTQNRIISQISIHPDANGAGLRGVYELEEEPDTPPSEATTLSITARRDGEVADIEVKSTLVPFTASACSLSPPPTLVVTPARVVTTTNVSLSSPPTTVDGVDLDPADRVLVVGQTNAATNGLYQVGTPVSAAWTRTAEVGSTPAAETQQGLYVWVTEPATGYILTTADPITLGSTALTFSEITAGRITEEAIYHVLVVGGTVTGRLTLGTYVNETNGSQLTGRVNIKRMLDAAGAGAGSYTVGTGGVTYATPLNGLAISGTGVAQAETIHITGNIYGMNSFSNGIPARRHVLIPDDHYVSNININEKVLAGYTKVPPFYLGNEARNTVIHLPNPGYMQQANNFPSYAATKPSNPGFATYENILVEMDTQATSVLSVAIVEGGSGYTVNDLITVDATALAAAGGGTVTTPAQFKVATVGLNNRVTSLTLMVAGEYEPPIIRRTLPTAYVTSGAGVNCRVLVEWRAAQNFVIRNDLEVLATDAPSFPYTKTGNVVTWTPELQFSGDSTGITYDIANTIGRYSINRDLLTFEILMKLTSKGAATGNATITLPAVYTDRQGIRNVVPAGEVGTITVNSYDNMAGVTSFTARVTSDGTAIRLLLTDATDTPYATDANFTNTSVIRLSGTALLRNDTTRTVYEMSLTNWTSLWADDDSDFEETGALGE